MVQGEIGKQGEDELSPELVTPEERALLAAYRTLRGYRRETLLAIAETLVKGEQESAKS